MSSNENKSPESPLRKNNEADFLNLLKESIKKAVIYLFLFSATINVLTLILPLYSLQVFDRVLSSGSIPTLTSLSLIAFFSIALFSVFNSIRESILIRISGWLDDKLNNKIFRHCVNYSSSSGLRISGQFLNEATTVKAFVTSPQILSLFDLPWSFVFIFVMYLISPPISLLVTFGALVMFALTYFKEFKTKPQLKETNDLNYKNMRRGDEFIRYSEVIEAMGMLPNTYKLWKDEHNIVVQRNAETSFTASKLNSFSKFLRMVLQISIIGLGSYLALEKEMTFGGIIACSILSGKALQPFDSIMALWSSFGNFKDAYENLKKFLTSSAERPEGTVIGRPQGDITTEKIVFFRPGSQVPIIKGVSINIEAGDIIGMIGPSGSGKSTLIKLLAGIYKPSMGIVRMDGGDLYFRNREDIGKYSGYLPQSVDLMKGTIKQNISRFEPDAKDEDVILAAKKTGVHELILGLPQGYDTMIGEGNVELSGGQKQRVGLARAFYGEPSVIFLDEPNANLDGVGEQMLVKAIMTAKQEGKTVIMIGHKPAIINVTSKIMVVVEGAIADFGPRAEIMSKYTKGPRRVDNKMADKIGVVLEDAKEANDKEIKM